MLFDNIFQIAYVTRDIEKSMATFRTRANVRSEYFREATTEVSTPAGPAVSHVKLAFMWVGDFQYELIQPISGLEDIYGPALPKDDSLGMHHLCMRVSDWGRFRDSLKHQPYPIAFERESDRLSFLYLDARKELGHYLEYTNMSDDIWKMIGGR